MSLWASAEEIRAAYRRAVKRAHPDQGGSAEAFRRVQKAADALLAEAAARAGMEAEAERRKGDTASASGDWLEVSEALAAKWARMPTIVFAPPRIGLSPFATGRELNRAAYRWLVRTAGPRGGDWDFHTDGVQTRVFFRRGEDAKRFQLRFR